MVVTRKMPPMRGIMAVDAVGFSKNPSRPQPELSAAIPQVLAEAFDRCDLSEVWSARRFEEGTGDGYLFGVPHEDVPCLLHPLLDTLQEVLEEHDERLRARSRTLRLRLRVAVNMGAVPDDGGDPRDGIGTPTNDTFRLLDSRPIREVMANSNPDVTLLGAIVSERVFQEAVVAGHTELHPDRFERVTAEVKDKAFAQPAYLYVPTPSRKAGGDEPDAEPPGRSAPPVASSMTSIHGNVGNSISGGTFTGNVQQSGGALS
ncbi:hypothetical protein ABZ801_04880 [Actinomadura sp. NPDC047616]|uniref:hypothetical protein n=1 Tax=Actinomadura sp. NPDC047616 TaxID=3155914 RepID=UPI0034080BBF